MRQATLHLRSRCRQGIYHMDLAQGLLHKKYQFANISAPQASQIFSWQYFEIQLH